MKHLNTFVLLVFSTPAALAHEDQAHTAVQHALHHLGQLEYLLLAGATGLAAVCWYGWKQYRRKQKTLTAQRATVRTGK